MLEDELVEGEAGLRRASNHVGFDLLRLDGRAAAQRQVRFVADIDTVFVLAVRSQRESGYERER